jgi:peptidoglycan hydrolase CwlO-like protein
MGASGDQRIEELLGVLDTSLLEFEELLGELADQAEKTVPKLESLAREQRESRAEIAELREMIESLTQRVERLTSILTDSHRER